LISSYGNQGIFDAAVTLVALGPTPAAFKTLSEAIPIGHTAPGPCDIAGKIVAVTPDKAFEILFSGAFHGRERFVVRTRQVDAQGSPSRSTGHLRLRVRRTAHRLGSPKILSLDERDVANSGSV
jgi:hypothetical protein